MPGATIVLQYHGTTHFLVQHVFPTFSMTQEVGRCRCSMQNIRGLITLPLYFTCREVMWKHISFLCATAYRVKYDSLASSMSSRPFLPSTASIRMGKTVSPITFSNFVLVASYFFGMSFRLMINRGSFIASARVSDTSANVLVSFLLFLISLVYYDAIICTYKHTAFGSTCAVPPS